MRIVLSKDRPAQLDLLLRTMVELTGWEATAVVWTASTAGFDAGYTRLRELWAAAPVRWLDDRSPPGFEGLVRSCVTIAASRKPGPGTVTFLCDDGMFVRAPSATASAWLDSGTVLCYSLRLGDNTTVCYPTGAAQAVPSSRVWMWAASAGDFGYPGSVDAHIFRAADVHSMLEGRPFTNPTELELQLVHSCSEIGGLRPLMARPRQSCYVGVPLNRTSLQSGVRNGGRPEFTADALNERWLQGDRLELPADQTARVDGAHAELELVWAPARVPA